MKVITYAYAYAEGEVTLCRKHRKVAPAPLGPVQHGQHDGECDLCAPLGGVPEEILDLLNDLIEWDAYVMQSECEVWQRARLIRDRISIGLGHQS